MKMRPAVVCLAAGSVLLSASAAAVASGRSAKERQVRQHSLRQSDYHEHLTEKHQVGSSLWWELKRRNVR